MHSGGTKPFDQRHYDESAGEAFFRLKGIDMELGKIQRQAKTDILMDDDYLIINQSYEDGEVSSVFIAKENLIKFVELVQIALGE